jgi:hypothetical protein
MSAGHVAALAVLVRSELLLRLRRPGTLVALLAVVAISWSMIADPRSGHALLVINHARVLYTSAALALGSAALGAILFGLGGFYLARGRMAEDLRSGLGGVIGATPAGSTLFLLSRWCGAVVYLGGLALAFMLTMLVLQALRGERPVDFGVYLATYALLMTPMLLFSASCAVMFDAVSALMGKAGDVLFFCVWTAQVALVAALGEHGVVSPALMADFTGLASIVTVFQQQLHAGGLSIGSSPFDPALAPLTLTPLFWSPALVSLRCAAALLSLLPLLPARLLFHRFSPDRVKAARTARRTSPLAFLNRLLHPLSRLVQPLLRLAPRLPGMAGQVAAEVALTLAASPVALLLLAGAWLLTPFADGRALNGIAAAAVLCWCVLIADTATRDFQAGLEAISGVLAGGAMGRYLRQLLAAAVFGLLFVAPAALRWLALAPLRAAVAVSGVVCLAAAAQLLGCCARTPRLFLALFLFGFYVAVNVDAVPALDVAGFNGVATVDSMLAQSAVALLAVATGLVWSRRRDA